MIAHLIARIILLPFLVFISIHDIKTKKIPNWVHPILLCAAVFVSDIGPPARLLGACISSIPCFLYSHFTKKMGMGDVKLIFSFGWCIGFLNIFATAAANLIFIITTFRQKNEPIPFAPYLCGAFGIFLFLPYILML